MITIPQLEKYDFDKSPLTTQWRGAGEHIGPVETVTKLSDRLAGKTTCATLTMMSGVILWGAARLKPYNDTDFLLELAEALFAWQVDWRYANPNVPPKGKPPEQPVEASAPMVLRSFTRKAILSEQKWHSFYQPIMELFHMANVVQFILPDEAKTDYAGWLDGVAARLNQIAPGADLEVPNFADFESKTAYRAYCAPRRGIPLPPSVLDLDQDITDVDLQAEALSYLGTLDPAKNRYLRSTAELIDMGFEGDPYWSAA